MGAAPFVTINNMASAPAVAQNAGAVDRFFEYSVLALVACGHAALAVTGYLDWVSLLVAPAAIAVRALRTAGYIRYTVSNTALLLTIAAASAIYAVDLTYVSRMFLPAALHAGTLLGAALILCAATDRHLWLLRALAYAELLAAAIVSSNAVLLTV